MKLLILTQYFPPEVGAPQNRLFELAVRLQKKGIDVTILTAMPNYPQMKIHEAYKGKYYHFEEMEGLKVHRSWIFVSSSKNIVVRLINYFSFVFSSFFIGLFKLNKFDYILVESPPLFLGISGYLLTKIKKAKLIFNVSDLWPESAEKLGLVTNKLFLRLATLLEEFLYKKSALITGQTQGIVKNISGRFPAKDCYWLPNGVDMNYYDVNQIKSTWRQENGFNENDFILLYAGIIGHAQGLEVILHAANKLKEQPSIKFILLGSGPEKEKLLQLKEQLQLNNVYFFNAVPKTEMPSIVAACDVAVIPLKRLDLFKGAIPSKIFENLAMKKVILLGVEGEAKELFIDQGKAGLAFVPEDATDLMNKVLILHNDKNLCVQLGINGFKYVETNFTRDQIATKFYEKINHLSSSNVIDTIKNVYNERKNDAELLKKYQGIYSEKIVYERELLYKQIIQDIFSDLSNIKVLEIGAGTGGNIPFFQNIGIPHQNIYANELVEDRLKELSINFPQINIIKGNAADIDNSIKFDIVFQSTVFTSILDKDLKQSVAKKMWELLSNQGVILWYDFTYDNPGNKNVKGIGKSEIKALFSKAKSIRFYKVTLAPPIGRRVQKLYSFFNAFPFLRTHVIAVIQK